MNNKFFSVDRKWKFIRKVGEGASGEVYLVEVDNREAILKRPAPGVLNAQRQAPQIVHEGDVLYSLLNSPILKIGLSLEFTNIILRNYLADGVENCFLLMERAKGFNLVELAKVSELGLTNSGIYIEELSKDEEKFLQAIEADKHIPDFVILMALDALLSLLPRIHKLSLDINGEQKYGIIWNDVKPDHLYWDISTNRITVIDWGNSRFLEKDLITSDRRFSPETDYHQFFGEMGKFLRENSPKLKDELGWSNPKMDVVELHNAIRSIIQAL